MVVHTTNGASEQSQIVTHKTLVQSNEVQFKLRVQSGPPKERSIGWKAGMPGEIVNFKFEF